MVVQDHSAEAHRSQLALRQSYSTAIIRLVNGLVDPLQFGAYARSIASIANQLGLPSWLVELRHASTHEDLPSLELLREAAREVRSSLALAHLFAHFEFSVPELASSQLSTPDYQSIVIS